MTLRKMKLFLRDKEAGTLKFILSYLFKAADRTDGGASRFFSYSHWLGLAGAGWCRQGPKVRAPPSAASIYIRTFKQYISE